MRLDVKLLDLSFVKSRTKAQYLINSGLVRVNGKTIYKSSFKICDDDKIEITDSQNLYVSRGAYKLEKAIEKFKINVTDKTCIDIGCSTGGFTQVLLKNQAKKIYCIDIGSNQMDESISSDNRVLLFENYDARNIYKSFFKDKIDIIVSDISFISLNKIAYNINDVLDNEAVFTALIKPQFECGKIYRKNGIYNDKNLHEYAINSVRNTYENYGIYLNDICPSPIIGKGGNIEYLALMSRDNTNIYNEKYLKDFIKNSLRSSYD